MSDLWIQETYVNATEGYTFGKSDVYETFTDNRGELYRFLQKEYGRCTGKVYADTDSGTRAVGWVFVGRQKGEHTGDTYLREVWVTVHDAPPTKTIEYHYAVVS